jgi:hypothetical protein
MRRVPRGLRTKAPADIWQAELEQTRQLTDALGMPVDPGIEHVVTVLRLMGFQTSMSCEGHLNWGLVSPWVDIAVNPSVARLRTGQQASTRAALVEASHADVDRARQSFEGLLGDFYRNRRVDPAFRLTTTEILESRDDGQPELAIGFRVACAASHLLNDDNLVGRIRSLSTGKREMQAFTDFLVEHHLGPALDATAAMGGTRDTAGQELT